GTEAGRTASFRRKVAAGPVGLGAGAFGESVMEGGAGPMGAGWHFHTTYTSLPKAFYRRLPPAPAPKPQLLLLNEGLARELGLDPEALRGDEGAALFSGNRLPEGAESLAMAYAGHQF